ncbi:hypothetical protein, partial [Salmonella enterica]|uniref:hypothetical protein n=1 Tax=Salmonella enterica TaxID=28901 RepID=UPI001C384D03
SVFVRFALNNQLTPKIERKVRKSYRFFPGLQLKDLQIPIWIADLIYVNHANSCMQGTSPFQTFSLTRPQYHVVYMG